MIKESMDPVVGLDFVKVRLSTRCLSFICRNSWRCLTLPLIPIISAASVTVRFEIFWQKLVLQNCFRAFPMGCTTTYLERFTGRSTQKTSTREGVGPSITLTSAGASCWRLPRTMQRTIATLARGSRLGNRMRFLWRGFPP